MSDEANITIGRRVWVTAAVIGLSALLLRLWGVAWSLPYVDHPDEPAVMGVVMRIAEGQLNPNFFFYPSLMLYAHALVLKLHLWWGAATGLYADAMTLPESTHFYTTIPQAFVWARGLTALLGAATAFVLATWGGTFLGRRAALVAALLLALSPWAVLHAHYMTVDVPSAFTGLLTLLAILGVLRRGTWRDYLLAGALLGVAAGTKYQNGLFAATLVLAHVLRWRWAALRQSGKLIAAGALSLAIFLAISPYILLDQAAFRRDITRLVESYAEAHGDVVGFRPIGAYLRFVWSDMLGPAASLLALAGAAALARRRPGLLAVLLSFPVLLLSGLLNANTHFFRNLLPGQPALLLLAGFGAVALWEAVGRRVPRAAASAAAGLGLLILLGPPSVAVARQDVLLAQPDSRVVAQEWLRREMPGARVASELSHQLLSNGLGQSTHFHYLPLKSLSWYRDQGYGALLASSSTRRKFDWTDDYQPLLQEGRVLATFGGPGSGERGPRIDLIGTGLTPESAAIGPHAAIGPVRLIGARIGRLHQDENGKELVETARLRSGEPLGITAFWSVDQPAPPGNYMTFIHVLNEQGGVVAGRDTPPWLGLFPPSSWRPGTVVAESLDVALPPLPPGRYRLTVGMYDSVQLFRYPATSGDVRFPDEEVDLGVIEIEP